MDLSKRILRPEDIEAASNGYLTKRVRQTIDHREQWAVQPDPAPPGKARPYRIWHAYEAGIIGAMVRRGFTIGRAQNAILRRLTSFTAGPAGYVDDALSQFPDLPELQEGAEDWYWLVFLEAGLEEDRGSVVGVRAVRGDARIGETVDDGFPLVLPISVIAKDVRERVRESMAKRELAD